MRTKRSSKTQYYLMSVTPVSDVQLMALRGHGVETVPAVEPVPVPVTRKYGFRRGNKLTKKPMTVKVKSGRGGARPGAGHKPVVEGTTQHERVMKGVIKHLTRGGPQRIVDLFEAVESDGSDEFGIRTNTPRRSRVNRFRALLQREAVRLNSRIVKRPHSLVALSRKA